MTVETTTSKGAEATDVADVSGAAPAVRELVARSSAEAEAATATLREAVRELRRSDDEAWQRYAVDLEEATRRFDTTVGLATTRLRAERAASKEELGTILDDVLETWRTRADELRVRAHVGQMNVRDLTEETVAELDEAGRRLTTVVTRLRSDMGESLGTLRDEARTALDDVADILRGVARRS
jgi:hypothetical protein